LRKASKSVRYINRFAGGGLVIPEFFHELVDGYSGELTLSLSKLTKREKKALLNAFYQRFLSAPTDSRVAKIYKLICVANNLRPTIIGMPRMGRFNAVTTKVRNDREFSEAVRASLTVGGEKPHSRLRDHVSVYTDGTVWFRTPPGMKGAALMALFGPNVLPPDPEASLSNARSAVVTEKPFRFTFSSPKG